MEEKAPGNTIVVQFHMGMPQARCRFGQLRQRQDFTERRPWSPVMKVEREDDWPQLFHPVP